MFKWGKQTVVFKVRACLSGGFLSACHFESLVFSPCCSTLTLTCSFCWLLTKRSVHSATSWKPIVTSDSGKVMHHSLGKTENYIWNIKWHLLGIIPFGIFCTSLSGNSPLARPISGFKYLHEIFNQVVLCNEHIATLVLCLMYVGDQLS